MLQATTKTKEEMETHSTNPKRRRLLVGVGLAAAAAGIWSMVGPVRPAAAAPSLIDFICDQTIPQTDTPGALSAGVPQFLQLAVQHGLAGAKPGLLAMLSTELDHAAGGRYGDLATEDKIKVLNKHDAACYEGGRPNGALAWPTVKRLILIGYYTSEPGGSHELRYELDPGGFQPDLPYKSGDRAYVNDWFGTI
jgi:hypothetical protein